MFNVPVAGPPPLAIVYQEMSPPAPDHMEELRRNQSTTPVDTQPPGSLTTSSDEPHREVTSLVTKSLSALKSRKEQIIGKGPSWAFSGPHTIFIRCILDVLWCQPIKLIRVVSTSEFHEY